MLVFFVTIFANNLLSFGTSHPHSTLPFTLSPKSACALVGHYSLGDPSAGGVVGVRWRMRGPAIMLLGLTSPCPGAMVAPLPLTASVELSLDVCFFWSVSWAAWSIRGGMGLGLAELLSALEIFSSKWSRLNLFSLELDEGGFFEFLGFHKRQ